MPSLWCKQTSPSCEVSSLVGKCPWLQHTPAECIEYDITKVKNNLQVKAKLKSKWGKSTNFLLHNGDIGKHKDHILLVTYQLLQYNCQSQSTFEKEKDLQHHNLGHHGLAAAGGQ